MWIRRNLAIFRHDRTLKDASRCHQQLVGWIAMERSRKLGGFHDDPRIEGQKRDARLRQGVLYPKPDGPIKIEPAALRKLRHFPTRNDANAEDSVGPMFEKVAMSRWQLIRARDPPDPDVGIQQDYRRASQSSLATGSNGSWNSRTDSRRLWLPDAVDPAVFESTNTSTGWPGSNGRPCKTSSPCSPTAASLQCACTP